MNHIFPSCQEEIQALWEDYEPFMATEALFKQSSMQFAKSQFSSRTTSKKSSIIQPLNKVPLLI